MNPRPLPVTAILAAGVGLGSAGDFLLRAPEGPGLNFSLLFAGLAASVAIVSLSGGPRLETEARVWLSVGVAFGAGLMWRGSELLRLLAFLGASLAFAFPAYRAGRAWVRRAGMLEMAGAAAAAGLYAALGSLRLLRREGRDAVGPEASRSAARTAARTALIGAVVAAGPLAVFGALFMSADAVFAGLVRDFVRIDLQAFTSHLMLAAVLSWLACGYLVGCASGTRMDALDEIARARLSLRPPEVATALGLVDLLFAAFVVVQFRYLFGGHGWVEVTPGLTYAAYAREGFFQLVVATALGLPWLLAIDALHGERQGSAHRLFQGLAGTQLLLLLAIVASAVQRMRVYLDAYGLTESRIVALAVLGWSALLVVWFGATVLRGRRAPFAFGALTSALGLVMLLQVANPAALAVSSHLDRAASPLTRGAEDGPTLDIPYLASLGSDAAPILVERLPQLNGSDRCIVARGLLSRWGPDLEPDWRAWNMADMEAREAVSAEAERLRTMARDGEACR